MRSPSTITIAQSSYPQTRVKHARGSLPCGEKMMEIWIIMMSIEVNTITQKNYTVGKKNNFRKTWKTLTELGQEFGVSAVKFGNLLKQHGLREKDGEPSQLAKDGAIFEKITPKEGKPYYLWHSQKTSEYLVSQGVAKNSVSAEDAEKMTSARLLARSYMEAQKLDDEGSKLGYMMLSEMVDDIKKVGLERFNQALKSIGYKGDEVNLEGW